MHPHRIEPAPGQESVWDYPRPPRLEPTKKRIQVVFQNLVIADSVMGWRVLETSHPPVYYLPQQDIRMEFLTASPGSSFCEWKGAAGYFDLEVNNRRVQDVAWFYANPVPAFAPIKNHLAFYAGRVDACYVDSELVTWPGGCVLCGQ